MLSVILTQQLLQQRHRDNYEGSDVSSSHGGEGRPCLGDVGMAGTGAVEESRCREDDVLGGLGQPGLGVAFCTHERGEGPLQGGVGGAIFRTGFDLGTESIVRVSVRVRCAMLSSDSPSTHPACEMGWLRRHRGG